MKHSTLVIGASGALLAFVAVALAQQETPPPTQSLNTPVIQYLANPPESVRIYSTQTDVAQVPVRVQAERQVNDLIRKWKAAEDDAARDKVEDELRGALNESFEARLQAHEQQIQELELQIKRLREQLDLRREKQEDIVDFRLEQLLREAQGLGWGADGSPSRTDLFYGYSRRPGNAFAPSQPLPAPEAAPAR